MCSAVRYMLRDTSGYGACATPSQAWEPIIQSVPICLNADYIVKGNTAITSTSVKESLFQLRRGCIAMLCH